MSETIKQHSIEFFKFLIQIIVLIFSLNQFVVSKIDNAVALEQRLTRIETKLEVLMDKKQISNFN